MVNKTLLLAGSVDQRITSFRIMASNDSLAALNYLTLTGSNLNALSNIRLVDSNMVVLNTA